MKLTNKAVDQIIPSGLESQILAYQFAAEQAKAFEARRAELSDLIKAQLPVNEAVQVGSFTVRVSEFSERRFMSMAEAEKIVGMQIINQIAKACTKQRLTVK
jgi:hypothetical protein